MLQPLKHRIFDSELMDLPDSDPHLLHRTLSQFQWTNLLFSRSRSLLRNEVLSKVSSSFSILDVGAGGCDIMRWLALQCRRKDLKVRIVCVDNDPRVVDFARKQCLSFPEITVVNGDIFNLDIDDRFDYVYCNNFLHHFEDSVIPIVLNRLNEATKKLLIVNDIYRSQVAYWGYGLFSSLFLHRSFARYDGMLSIRKGFKLEELQNHAQGLESKNGLSLDIKKMHPSRIVLTTGNQDGTNPQGGSNGRFSHSQQGSRGGV